jgi:hypothetical protein
MVEKLLCSALLSNVEMLMDKLQSIGTEVEAISKGPGQVSLGRARHTVHSSTSFLIEQRSLAQGWEFGRNAKEHMSWGRLDVDVLESRMLGESLFGEERAFPYQVNNVAFRSIAISAPTIIFLAQDFFPGISPSSQALNML